MSTQINWPLFERTVAAIKANPGSWKQSSWHCGTSHCFAGFTHILDLMDRGIITSHIQNVESEDDAEIELYGEVSWDVARQRLGLSFAQEEWLFNGYRSLADFEECISRRAVPTFHEKDRKVTVWP